MRLKDLYRRAGRPVVTAHRGFSGRYPENTLTAFRKAVELGADIVEFDVRETADGELVVIHDESADRTTDGTGLVKRYAAAELKKLNAAYWRGPHDTGARSAEPNGHETVPTLEETVSALAGKAGLNIQVYAGNPAALERIVRLYLRYDLRDSAFLMLDSFAEAKLVRAWSPDVAICVGEDRPNLDRHLAFGVDFIQPTTDCLTDPYLRRIRETGAAANVFYANTPPAMAALIDKGVPGIITDRPDLLIDLIRKGNPGG